MSSVVDICKRASDVAAEVAALSGRRKDAALHAMADGIAAERDRIVDANNSDVEHARKDGISSTMIDRLTLTDQRLRAMVDGLRAVASQPDPVGQVIEGWTRPNGLLIQRVRVPLGVVGVIYEARPNVTSDVAALCLKAGNACILRGSSIAIASNTALAEVLRAVLDRSDVPTDAVQLITDTDRSAAVELMQADGYVDLLVPRGGKELIETMTTNATVPYIIDGDGNCHVYVDRSADPDMATSIIVNAKTQRPSVCNAAETLLVHQEIADKWLPLALGELARQGVEIRGDERVRQLHPEAVPATDDDWGTEYLDLVLAVKVVASLDDAIAHIGRWGTSNADAIVTQDHRAAMRFAREVDSGSIFINASTRFSDGDEFGFGAEIGISTQKLHSRGPMGLEALTSVKYVVYGDGQTRE